MVLGTEVVEGVVICVDGEVSTMEVDSPVTEGIDNGEQLSLMSGVVLFGGVQGSRVECDGVDSLVCGMFHNYADRILGGVGGYDDG